MVVDKYYISIVIRQNQNLGYIEKFFSGYKVREEKPLRDNRD